MISHEGTKARRGRRQWLASSEFLRAFVPSCLRVIHQGFENQQKRRAILSSSSFSFCAALLLIACSAASANESQTILLAQPIVGMQQGIKNESSEDVEFQVVDVPFLDWSPQGHPYYQAIAFPNQILTNAARDASLSDNNLLALYGIRIGYGIESEDLWLLLKNARSVNGWKTTIEDAAYAGLECIRIVANRYHDHPKVHISPPKGEETKWKEVEKRFREHDFSKPFTKPKPS